ncbi:tyrosine-type recombinase/integrase [Desulfobacula sp.]
MVEIENKIHDFFERMETKGYTKSTLYNYRCWLNRFFKFVKNRKIIANERFTFETLKQFQKVEKNCCSAPIKKFAQYLYTHHKIPEPFQIKRESLPEIFEQYIKYYGNRCQGRTHVLAVRRMLSSLNAYLVKSAASLHKISISQIDNFLALYNKNFAPGTCKLQRSYMRGFLKYLYQHGHTKKNFAALVICAPEFARAIPPKFLRPEELQRLFGSLDLFSKRGLRANAIIHLAYYLGLRPKEITLLTLEDLSFKQKEIYIKTRKNFAPMQLPLPDTVIKAITAYIVGSRPESKSRHLFLQIATPNKPIQTSEIYHDVKIYMVQNNISASVYWLRHSFAQNLLEAGATIYEIKEMMGHKNIESSRKYLSIHINLMRKVIVNETV